MPDVFISYSRRNLEFVMKLADALDARGKEVWFDQKKEALEGIPPASKWWEEIKYGIETADNFLFIISSPSIVSPYCNAEIAYALHHEKRLVTVLYHGEDNEGDTLIAIDEAIESIPEDRELPSSVSASLTNLRTLARQNWLQVSQVQYVAFSGNQAFDWALDQLVRGLDMDLAWVKTHSQLRQAAQLWADNDYHAAYLWPEERLRPIRDMIERVQPDLGELMQDFIRPEYDRLWEQINDPSTHHRDRAAIGDRLDELGDCELRAGVGLVTQNLPELSEEEKARGTTRLWGENGTLLGMSEGYLGLPDIVWLLVAGVKSYQLITFVGPKGTYTIEDFYIAKYPVTYSQYRTFLQAEDGFHNPKWWDGLEANSDHKANPDEQNRPTDNHPAKNVSWYDAIAFCRWLNSRLALPQLPTNLDLGNSQSAGTTLLQNCQGIRLPTEWEWQYAATGGNPSYEYPWGQEWDDTRTNTDESGLSRITAVGMYPEGRAPCGALDMSGNVFDWCLNEYATMEKVSLGGNASRVVRGGTWLIDRRSARADCRNYGNPDLRDDLGGFRLVMSLPVLG